MTRGMGHSIGTGKRSPEILRELLDRHIEPRIDRDLEWPEAPPLDIASEGIYGLAGLLFEGRYPLAVHLGWTCLHARDSRAMGIEGLPDWIIMRETVIFVELKRQRDRLRPEQAEIAAKLMRGGAWYELWRPGDWERIGHILRFGTCPPVD